MNTPSNCRSITSPESRSGTALSYPLAEGGNRGVERYTKTKFAPERFGFLCSGPRALAPAIPGRSRLLAGRRTRHSNMGHALVLAIATLSTGCTYSGGELLYLMGVGRTAKVEAKFRLTQERLMVFVDDVHERVDWPQARNDLFDDLTQALMRHQAVTKIIPRESIDALRQSLPNFGRRGCRELGEMLEADQVLWVEVRDYLGDEQFTETKEAALWTVAVKVINVKEKKSRSRVRLWPMSPDGQLVTALLSGVDVARLKTKSAIARELSDRLAQRIAKLFYDHTPRDSDARR